MLALRWFEDCFDWKKIKRQPGMLCGIGSILKSRTECQSWKGPPTKSDLLILQMGKLKPKEGKGLT